MKKEVFTKNLQTVNHLNILTFTTYTSFHSKHLKRQAMSIADNTNPFVNIMHKSRNITTTSTQFGLIALV